MFINFTFQVSHLKTMYGLLKIYNIGILLSLLYFFFERLLNIMDITAPI